MSHSPPASPAAPTTDTLQTAKEQVRRTAEQWRDAASQKAADLKAGAAHLREEFSDRGEDFKEFAGDAIKQAAQQYEQFMVEAEELARQKPRKALYAAFGIGLALGLLLRR